MLEAAYDARASDLERGLSSFLIAGATADVSALDLRARGERMPGAVEAGGVALGDGTHARASGWRLYRGPAQHTNLRVRRGGWLHNGDSWWVARRYRAGSLTLTRLNGKGRARLPADYVAEAVQFGYATTHWIQGTTTDPLTPW
jgi:hypothetical protein